MPHPSSADLFLLPEMVENWNGGASSLASPFFFVCKGPVNAVTGPCGQKGTSSACAAATTNLATTFFDPAFSNSMSSLSPSIPIT